MTSTFPAVSASLSTTDSGDPVAAADRFLALVDQTRAAVQDALTADVAARAHRDDARHTGSSEDPDDTAGTEDASVPPTQLEQLVSGMLAHRNVAWAAVTVVG